MARASTAGLKLRGKIRSTSIEKLKSEQAKVKLLLAYGTLAPSTHNTQPWKFEIDANTLRVFIDFTKRVPVADPTTRDMYISLGALIKNVQLAAAEYGVNADVQFAKSLPGSDQVATLTFTNLGDALTPKRSTVLNGIVKRQNYRGFFKQRFDKGKFSSVVGQVLEGQEEVEARVVVAKSTIEKLAQLTAKGLRMGYAMPTFRREISSYVNHNLSRKKYGLHGYSLRLTTPQSLVIPHVMKHKDIGKKLARLNYQSLILSPAVIVLATGQDREASWLATGQVMEEIMVRLATAGLSTSIYTASVEMKGLREELMEILSIDKKPLPQVLFCVGTPGAPLPYSVRQSLAPLTKISG